MHFNFDNNFLGRLEIVESENLYKLVNLFKGSIDDIEDKERVTKKLVEKLISANQKKYILEAYNCLGIDCIIESWSEEDEAFFNYLVGCVHTQNYSKGIELFKRAHARFIGSNKFEEIVLATSVCYTELEDYQHGAELFERFGFKRQHLAYCYEMMEEFEKAIDVYEILLKKCETSAEEINITFNIGDIYRKQGKLKKARKYFEKTFPDFLMNKDVKYKISKCLIGYDILIENGDIVDAYDLLDRVIFKMEPGNKDNEIRSKLKAVLIAYNNKYFPYKDLKKVYDRHSHLASDELKKIFKKEVA